MKAVAETVDESEDVLTGDLEESNDEHEDIIINESSDSDSDPKEIDTTDGITCAIDALIEKVGDEVVVSYGDDHWALFALKEHLEDLEQELSSSYAFDEEGIYSLNESGTEVVAPVVAVLTE